MALAYQIHLVYVPLHLSAPDAVCLYEQTPAASQAQLQDCSKDADFELDHFALLRAAFITTILSTKCRLTLSKCALRKSLASEIIGFFFFSELFSGSSGQTHLAHGWFHLWFSGACCNLVRETLVLGLEFVQGCPGYR